MSTLLNTVTSLGNALLSDLNNDDRDRDQKTDVYQIPLAIDAETSKRSSPRGFILETANAVNADGTRKYHLDIALHTLATKIRFDQSSSTPRAIGVEYLSGERLYAADPYPSSENGSSGYIAASKEVIISAGTFNTPQLLKLSGIGPSAELQRFGIPIIKDLPGVGSNMQDRYEVATVYETEDKDRFQVSSRCTFQYDGQPDPCLDEWLAGSDVASRGPYTTSGAAVGVVLKSSAAASSEDPDLFIIGTPGVFNGFYPGFAYDSVISANKWSWLALKAHSHNSAGTVTLRSANPRDVPQIDFAYLDEGSVGYEKDLQALYEGLLWGREAFEKVNPLAGGFVEVFPGEKLQSEEELKQYAMDEAWGHHACCTAAIGAEGDSMAVLDGNFKVRGVQGLRVVDASIFPKIPGTFIALPTYMVSEKAAEAILSGR